jgi:(4S)-4-hydroxy-5-phosphonooxypentane-2,3-dione isomerase
MIKRIVKMSFHADKVETFLAVYRKNWTAIRSFPGCRHVELLRATADKAVFFTYSVWENNDALESYRRSPLFEGVWGATKVLFNDKPLAWTVEDVRDL